jgi:hypothetical protein
LRAGAWVCAGGKNVAGRLAVWQAMLAKRLAVSGAIRKESFVILIFSITYATSSFLQDSDELRNRTLVRFDGSIQNRDGQSYFGNRRGILLRTVNSPQLLYLQPERVFGLIANEGMLPSVKTGLKRKHNSSETHRKYGVNIANGEEI